MLMEERLKRETPLEPLFEETSSSTCSSSSTSKPTSKPTSPNSPVENGSVAKGNTCGSFSDSSVGIILTLLAVLIVSTFGLLIYARKLRTRMSVSYVFLCMLLM